MKNVLLLFIFIFSGWIIAAGQPTCTPDPLYADSAYGVWPDTATDFPSATLGVYYETVLNIKIPTDAGAVDPQLTGLSIDSVRVNSNGGVTGLPPGLSYVCNQPRCKWNGGMAGCAVLYGTPTQAGIFDITINMEGFSHIVTTVLPFDKQFPDYRITVIDTSSGINELKANPFFAISPNPIENEAQFSFEYFTSTTTLLKIHNILGEEVLNVTFSIQKGYNSQKIALDFNNGLYIYTMQMGDNIISGKLSVIK